MTILFIADLHLSEKEPNITAGFIQFLQEQASQAKALYILGDFFDYWIGDDDPNQLHKIIAQNLNQLKISNIPCYFIHGNRDFLLDKQFAKASGIILLPEEKVLTIHGNNILILHGDTLCTADFYYQYYRKIVHKRWLQWLFLTFPLSIRQYIAEIIYKNSHYNSVYRLKQQHINLTEINYQKVMKKFDQYQVNWIIHGHTHKPAIHKMNHNGKILHRVVIGAWNKNGSSILKITSKSIELLHLYFC